MDALVSLESATGKPRAIDSDEADEFKLDRYVRKLREYPGDIVLHVLETWDDRPPPAGLFFPRIAELRPILTNASRFRRELLVALQACEPFDPPPPPPEETEADRQAVRRKYVETCKRMGTRPRADLLPDDYDGEAEPFRAPAPKLVDPNAGGLIAQRLEQMRADERRKFSEEGEQ